MFLVTLFSDVGDLLQCTLYAVLQTSPRENPDVCVDEQEVQLFRRYYSTLMYKVRPVHALVESHDVLCKACRLLCRMACTQCDLLSHVMSFFVCMCCCRSPSWRQRSAALPP